MAAGAEKCEVCATLMAEPSLTWPNEQGAQVQCIPQCRHSYSRRHSCANNRFICAPLGRPKREHSSDRLRERPDGAHAQSLVVQTGRCSRGRALTTVTTALTLMMTIDQRCGSAAPAECELAAGRTLRLISWFQSPSLARYGQIKLVLSMQASFFFACTRFFKCHYRRAGARLLLIELAKVCLTQDAILLGPL